MSANLISFPTQPQSHHNHLLFAQRATKVDRLIDAKCQLVMESARLQSLANSQPEQLEKYLAQIDAIGEEIESLQVQIDQEMVGLLNSLKAEPATFSPTTDKG